MFQEIPVVLPFISYRKRLLFSIVLTAVFLGASAAPEAKPKTPSADNKGAAKGSTDGTPITFVQITDVHIFDGAKRAGGLSEADDIDRDNWGALRWAINTTNGLIAAGRKIDFVVFTGDFGLELVRDPEDESKLCLADPAAKIEIEDYAAKKLKSQMRLFHLKDTAGQMARELSRLRVSTVYVLPGNNDLIAENPCDIGRYQEFVRQMDKAISRPGPQIVDLSLAPTGGLPRYGPFLLLGFNTAAFKKESNYHDFCAQKSGPGCPDFELDRLESALKTQDDIKLLLFTHIPDLKDPQDLKTRKSPQDCTLASDRSCDSWKEFPSRERWTKIASDGRIGAIFAGHFHSSERPYYATQAGDTPLAIDQSIADKTWVTPPLAAKFQEKAEPQARGFLLVRAQRRVSNGAVAVSTVPFWFPDRKAKTCHFPGRVLVWLLEGIAGAGLVIWLIAAWRAETNFVRRNTYQLVSTLGCLGITLGIVWVVMDFLVDRLSMHPMYWLVPLFGGFGGVVGRLLIDREFGLTYYEPADKDNDARFHAGLVGDLLVGIAGAATLAFVSQSLLNFDPGKPNSYVVVISVSLVAGVIGKSVVQIATEKLLKTLQPSKAENKSKQTSDS